MLYISFITLVALLSTHSIKLICLLSYGLDSVLDSSILSVVLTRLLYIVDHSIAR